MQIKVLVADSNDEWEEELTVSSLENAERDAQAIMQQFNKVEKERYGEKAKPRRFVSIIGQTCNLHQWSKQTAVADHKGNVVYRCSECGLREEIPHSSLCLPSPAKCYPDRVCRICNKQYASKKNYERHNHLKHCP